MSERLDDLDFEITPLNPSSDHHPPSLPAPDPSAMRRTRTQRALTLGSIIALVSLVTSLFILTQAGSRASLLHLLQRSTPQPDPSPTFSPTGDDAFLWEHSVPWGQLLIDGKPGPDVRGWALHAAVFHEPQGATFHLTQGRHTLEYRADLFPTLKCSVSVPASSADTCPLNQANSLADSDWSIKPKTRLLDLQATVDRLPAEQIQALLAATQTQLASLNTAFSTATLTAGDHFVDGAGQVRQASADLIMTPHLRLGSGSLRSDGLNCATLCSANGIQDAYSAQYWNLEALAALRWRYTNQAGEVLLDDGPFVMTGISDANGAAKIRLLTQWQAGSWQLQPASALQPLSLVCPEGNPYYEALQHQLEQTAIGTTFAWFTATATADLGCLYVGSRFDPSSGHPVGPLSLALYRAGALVTVNTQARQLFPTLPIASAHERALAEAVSPSALG